MGFLFFSVCFLQIFYLFIEVEKFPQVYQARVFQAVLLGEFFR